MTRTDQNASFPEAWILLGVLVVLWGTAFMLIQEAVKTITPATAVAIRIVTATVILLTAMGIARQRLPRLLGEHGPVNRTWGMLFVLGLTGNVIPFILISWGQQVVPSSLAGILMAIMPLTTMALAAVFVPGETITPRRLGGFVLGFAGLVVLFGPGALGLAGSVSWLAQLSVLSGACFYAVNAVLTKNRPPMPPLVAGAAIHICASLVIVPLAFALEDPLALTPSLTSLASVAILGIFCSAIATLILLRLIDLAGPTFTSQINYLIPVWATFLGMAVLGENPGPAAIPALLLILFGIALAQGLGRHKGAHQAHK